MPLSPAVNCEQFSVRKLSILRVQDTIGYRYHRVQDVVVIAISAAAVIPSLNWVEVWEYSCCCDGDYHLGICMGNLADTLSYSRSGAKPDHRQLHRSLKMEALDQLLLGQAYYYVKFIVFFFLSLLFFIFIFLIIF